MATDDPGASGIARIEIVLPDGSALSLRDLAAAEHIVHHEKVGIRLEVEEEAPADAPDGPAGEPEAGSRDPRGKGGGARRRRKAGRGGSSHVTVAHHWSGVELPAGAVLTKGNTRWITLFRGLNEVVVKRKDREDSFSFPLRYRGKAAEWTESLLKALILVVVVKTFVIQAFFIPTGSMLQTLSPSDFILVEKVTGLFARPERGDIIVFQYPEDPTVDYIKRMVGDAGDVLAMRDNQLYRGGQALREPYVFLGGNPSPGASWRPEEIPAHHSFAMGDNRNNSSDSRFWGPLPDYRLKGRALAIYWPIQRWGFVRPERSRVDEQLPRLAPGITLPPAPFQRTRRDRRAIEGWRSALRDQPGLHDIRYRLAEALLRINRPQEAIRELEVLSETLPENHELLPAVERFLLLQGIEPHKGSRGRPRQR